MLRGVEHNHTNPRKKCDEVHPICSRCDSRGGGCVWPDAAKSAGKSEASGTVYGSEVPRLPQNQLSPQAKSPQAQPDSYATVSYDDVFFDLDLVVHDLNEFHDDLTSFQTELEGLKSESVQEPKAPLPLPTTLPSISLSAFSHAPQLGAQGIAYLEYYRHEYCAFISIGLNYFDTTFMGISERNESIAYALAAWGGFYLELRKEKSDFLGPWKYMQAAAKCMCQTIGDNLQPRTKEEIFDLFAFYLIFIGIEVCTGDVRNWRSFMYQCARLLKSCGGLSRICEIFEHNNDIKWMLSDFEFHDIVSLKALASGPMFPLAEYDAAVDLDLSYGIDPLQGIVGPLYKLMCLIGSAKAELTRDWDCIESLLRNGSPQANDMRAAHYEKVQKTVEEFDLRIAGCEPLGHHMEILKNAPEKVLHLHLFDLYRNVCRIQLATAIERLPPKTGGIQLLLMRSLKLIDVLQNTRFKVSLSLLLMVCGMACCTTYDKTQMIQRFRLHLKQYELGNLQRIEETLLEVWDLNPNGDTCIDWADYVGGKGWHLYVG